MQRMAMYPETSPEAAAALNQENNMPAPETGPALFHSLAALSSRILRALAERKVGNHRG